MSICLQHDNPTSQAEKDIEPLSCLAAPSKINQSRARHELMPEKGNLTVFQPEVERSVIGHVVPQIKPVIIKYQIRSLMEIYSPQANVVYLDPVS